MRLLLGLRRWRSLRDFLQDDRFTERYTAALSTLLSLSSGGRVGNLVQVDRRPTAPLDDLFDVRARGGPRVQVKQVGLDVGLVLRDFKEGPERVATAMLIGSGAAGGGGGRTGRRERGAALRSGRQRLGRRTP